VISSTHTLLALALFTRKGEKGRNWSTFTGSVIPDAFIYVCATWLIFVKKVPQQTLWNEIYFDTPMQTTASIFNSVPLYLALLGIGLAFRKSVWGMCALFFALAALSHIALDFPVHNHDAYAHFWPLSDWKFFSPISYYETHLYGNWVGMVDAFIAIGAIYVLWRRFDKTWVRVILGIFLALTIGMLAMRLRMLLS